MSTNPTQIAPAVPQEPLPIVIVGHVDHGKSTLIGRLLHDTGSLDESQVAVVQAASAKRGDVMEWSYLLDALQVERDQGITIDTTRIWFRTAHRPYVIIDAPGHAEFLRNMVTGAASAAAAVLLVDAAQGLGEQTRRHSVLLSMLGVRQLVVAINKMDLVGHAQSRFEALQSELAAWLATLGLSAQVMIPLSARDGDNLVNPGTTMPWWQGPTLVEALDALQSPARPIERPLRLAVQDVYRRPSGRWAVGRVEAGRIRVGDEVRILPTNQTGTIAAIETGTTALSAAAGASVAVRFTDEVLLARGQMLVPPTHDATLADTLVLRSFWLDADPLMAGERLQLRLGTASVSAVVERIERPLDLATLEVREGTLVDPELGHGSFADLVLRLAHPIVVDSGQPDAASGRAVLLRHHRITGGGLVKAASRQAAATPGHAVVHPGTTPDRPGDVLWLFGLSGAGKSTLAHRLRAALIRSGRPVVILDGDALRLGLNADLGFSDADREANVRRTAHIAALLRDQGITVIVAVIAPSRAIRKTARNILGAQAAFIWIKADLETCATRDPKGLYARVQSGQLSSFTGVTSPFEPPIAPDLIIDTDIQNTDTASAQLLSFALARGSDEALARYTNLSEGL